jgi:hypothetical protein
MPRVAAKKSESPEVAELKSKLATVEAEVTRLRNVAPVTRNVHAIEASEMADPKLGEATMPSTGAPRIDHPEIEITREGIKKSKMDMLAFMAEKVVVEVHTSEDKYAEPVVMLWNDGRPQAFPRGVRVTCARKYVEVLARARPVRFGNVEYTDAEGNKAVKWPKNTGLKYPFTVHEDANPLGRPWLEKIRSEA